MQTAIRTQDPEPSPASRERPGRRFVAAPPGAPAGGYLERLLIRAGGRWQVVRLEEVDWIEGDGNCVRVHAGGTTYRYRQTLGGLEARLDPRRFVRIHRSTIVAIDRVAELGPLPSGCYDLVLADGSRLTLSRSHRRHLLELAGKA